MHLPNEIDLWHRRHDELLREAENERLARHLSVARLRSPRGYPQELFEIRPFLRPRSQRHEQWFWKIREQASRVLLGTL